MIIYDTSSKDYNFRHWAFYDKKPVLVDRKKILCIIACMKKEKKITKDMIIDDVIKMDERLGDVFMGFGMHCIFCHLGLEETVEEAAAVHYVDVDFLVEKLNEVYNQNKKQS